MSLWQSLLHLFHLAPARRTLHFDQSLMSPLLELAVREQRPADEIAADLLQGALHQRQAAEVNLQRWRNLTCREQEVAALVCLGYANAEIASRLSISVPTVKTHVRNALQKFGFSRRTELQHALADWDFNAWEGPNPAHPRD
ncbi:MAG TPA: helix-turn-helix transcriptional regulator [Anaerolineaceae bacterium]|nr:helix-turn-helix transcriptional regulator [Anaerolineaceae bacterium]HOH20430.1 helix-turn-helix transcriptional regulator [Anaerolineaceae bacterium]HQH35792.1 helix-turn-helix transcriptional regulator [Anaerolineaceae bacterium]HQJ04095.1 helix-turn-helix transcriptional regulator [Anaerolineaceae bacterium]